VTDEALYLMNPNKDFGVK